ncbi:unnamed protein product [Ostreobium quekettii]|uniref:Uncharacterized protein n=1 Tax=Ostreobium quekettii TaxID=121088 RepID=A0A8S1ITU7_9CHLO|nr:unnamed protein product [Ostreobium quekettii]
MFAAVGVGWWFLFLAASWGAGALAQADWREETSAWQARSRTASRHLLAPSAGGMTTQEAEDVLQFLGIDDHGPIVYMGRTADCPLTDLSSDAAATLDGFCEAIQRMRRCRGRDSREPGLARPLFHMSCQNQTCVETLSFTATACDLNARLGLPLKDAVNRSCELTLPETANTSKPHLPSFLTPDGRRSMFDCLLGWPTGTELFKKYTCVEGFFRLQVSNRLGGQAFVPDMALYRCIRDIRCGEGEEGGLWFEGEYICYLPEGSRVALTSWAAGGGGLVAPFLWACALLLSVVWRDWPTGA